jgi:hypothetical protein
MNLVAWWVGIHVLGVHTASIWLHLEDGSSVFPVKYWELPAMPQKITVLVFTAVKT